MDNDLKETINLKAHFIAGVPAQDREATASIQKVKNNAYSFIKSLPNEYQNPDIFAGTIADPSVILHLAWRNFEAGWHYVAVDFKENDVCTVYWHNPDRSLSEDDTSSLNELIGLDIPSKIDNLKKITPKLSKSP